MTPFVYPKIRHKRTENPPAYKQYKSYKSYLRREFFAKCVYCLMPDTMRGEAQYGVDHYRPQSAFPELANEYENLFYCCNACNSRKGNYWPKRSSANELYIPNPCDNQMFDHLRYQQAVVKPISKPGTFTAEYLDLNDPAVIARREEMLHLIDLLPKHLRELDELKAKVQAALAAGKCSQAEHDAAMEEIVRDRGVTERILARQIGTAGSAPD